MFIEEKTVVSVCILRDLPSSPTPTGLQPVNGISINVELPIEIFNGKWLLYPFNADVMAGNTVAGSCNTTYVHRDDVTSAEYLVGYQWIRHLAAPNPINHPYPHALTEQLEHTCRRMT